MNDWSPSIDERMLALFREELGYIRDLGAEFGEQYPQIAPRLSLEETRCQDPYVERLLEGVAFLTAGVRQQLESAFPKFTSHLLRCLHPAWTAPTPPMAIVEFEPDFQQGDLAAGVLVPRGAAEFDLEPQPAADRPDPARLRTRVRPNSQDVCEWRTAHDVTLWPIALPQAQYVPTPRDLSGIGLHDAGAESALRIRLAATANKSLPELALDALHLHLTGPDQLPDRMLEQIVAHCTGVVVRRCVGDREVLLKIGPEQIRQMGFRDDEALLPSGSRDFSGYRILHEFFAFPERARFVEIAGLQPALRAAGEGVSELDLFLLFDRRDPELERIEVSHFRLFCSPAINLVRKTADLIRLDARRVSYQLIVDTTRPADFEVYDILSVNGLAARAADRIEFHPYHGLGSRTAATDTQRWFTTLRRQRRPNARDRQRKHSDYLGDEVFLSIVDADQRGAQWPEDVRQVEVQCFATNRDLPTRIEQGGWRELSLLTGQPVKTARLLTPPTAPRRAPASGDTAWRLVNHLTLNHVSLADANPRDGAAALRDMLGLYTELLDENRRPLINSIRSLRVEPTVERYPGKGPVTFVRGLQVHLTLEEMQAAADATTFALGAALDRFFVRYATLNSFTQTVLHTTSRGEVARWPARVGERKAL